MIEGLLAALEHTPVIGVMRGCPFEHSSVIGAAAADAGFAVLEITMDSPRASEAIAALAAALPAVTVGAGTVRSPAEVEEVAAAGARFVVSPVLSLPVLEAGRRLGVPVVPGAATPSEIWSALAAGAAAVKVFPARELGGPDYLQAIQAPLGDPPLIPTGGVDASNLRAYLDAGALAVGLGGSVFPTRSLTAGDATAVHALAAEAIRAI